MAVLRDRRAVNYGEVHSSTEEELSGRSQPGGKRCNYRGLW